MNFISAIIHLMVGGCIGALTMIFFKAIALASERARGNYAVKIAKELQKENKELKKRLGE